MAMQGNTLFLRDSRIAATLKAAIIGTTRTDRKPRASRYIDPVAASVSNRRGAYLVLTTSIPSTVCLFGKPGADGQTTVTSKPADTSANAWLSKKGLSLSSRDDGKPGAHNTTLRLGKSLTCLVCLT